MIDKLNASTRVGDDRVVLQNSISSPGCPGEELVRILSRREGVTMRQAEVSRRDACVSLKLWQHALDQEMNESTSIFSLDLSTAQSLPDSLSSIWSNSQDNKPLQVSTCSSISK
uniref:Uncharacterized protein n=1 Tax=Heterorhabditis bacteriophora TaxID=37862 RepID=A0A1I7XEE8_HETBA